MRPEPPAFSDRTKKGMRLVLLECLHEVLALGHRRVAMQHEAGAAEGRGEQALERRR